MKANFSMPKNLAAPLQRRVIKLDYSELEKTPEVVLDKPFAGSPIRFMTLVMTTLNKSDVVNRQMKGYKVNWVVANIPVASRKVSDGEQWLSYMLPKEEGHMRTMMSVFGHSNKLVNPGQISRKQAHDRADPYLKKFLQNKELKPKPVSIIYITLKPRPKAPEAPVAPRVNQQTAVKDPPKREMPVTPSLVQPDQVIEKDCKTKFRKCFEDTKDLSPTDRVKAMRICQRELAECRNPEITRRMRCRKMFTDCTGKISKTADFSERRAGLKACRRKMQKCVRPDGAAPLGGSVNIESRAIPQKNLCLETYIKCLQKLRQIPVQKHAQYVKDCQDQYKMCMEKRGVKKDQSALSGPKGTPRL